MPRTEEQLNKFLVDFFSQAILKPWLEVNFPKDHSHTKIIQERLYLKRSDEMITMDHNGLFDFSFFFYSVHI